MKTAISIPDELFRQAEVIAHRLCVTRSELYAKAIAEFLKKEDVSAITESLNQLYSAHPAELDATLHRAQLRSLKEDDW